MIVIAAVLLAAVPLAAVPYVSSCAAQTTPVRLGARDPTMFALAHELCEVLRRAQDDGN